MTGRWCIDTSAWHRSTKRQVQEALREALEADRVSICDQVKLEILYSAQSASDYDELSLELDSLHRVPTTGAAYARALEVQAALAHVGGLHHRSVKIADLLIAASAEGAGDVVWHYDEDFDRIAVITGQPCEWIAPRGSL